MKTTKTTKKLALILLALLALWGKGTLAQDKPALVNFPSPNAASLGMYGEVPVSHFTGVPNIQIPLTELKDGVVSLPLSLSYHISSVRPNSRAGWVGLGWTLNAGGVITRTVRGYVDEDKNKYQSIGIGFYDQYRQLDQADWDLPSRLWEYCKAFSGFGGLETVAYEGPFYDSMADEFSFNFLGYSGRFMLGHDGKWKVVSDHDIKVEFNASSGFIDEQKVLWRASNVATNPYYDIPDEMKNNHHRYFNEFTLITPDGTRYVFGGQKVVDSSSETVADATEFSVGYRGQDYGVLVPTSWYLTRIIPVSGAEVTLRYRPGPLVASVSNSVTVSSVATVRNGQSCDSYSFSGHGYTCENGEPVSTVSGKSDGFLILPVYLESITSPNFTVRFSTSTSDELNYSDKDLMKQVETYPFSIYLNHFSELEWKKLDAITVSGNDGKMIKKFELGYYPTTDENGRKRRLKLHKVTSVGRDAKPSEPFVVEYDDIVWLPPYNVDAVDHWGYFNGADLCNMPNVSVDTYHTLREPDVTGVYQRAETIKRIIYPTKGYTEFSFDPHSYYKVVDLDRISFQLNYSNRTAGGLRVKDIKSYNYDGKLTSAKQYYYARGYDGVTSPSQLNSSGILGGLSQYAWPDYQSKDIEGNSYTYSLFNSGSLLPYGLNGDGSHIGYSEVVELSEGNGYTKYVFSNFDTESTTNPTTGRESTSVAYGDLPANGRTHYATSVYSPFNGRELLRGKLLYRHDYDESNREVRKVIMDYGKSSEESLRVVEVKKQKLCSGVSGYYATAYQIPLYRFNMVREETTYTDASAASVSTVKEYSFNGSNFIKEQGITDSKGQKQVIQYKYPGDYTTAAVLEDYYDEQVLWCANNAHIGHCTEIDRDCYAYNSCEEFAAAMVEQKKADNAFSTAIDKMKTLHILSPVLEELVWLHRPDGKKLIGSVLNKYKDFGAGRGGIQIEETLKTFPVEPIAEEAFTQSSVDSDFQFVHDSRYRREVHLKEYDSKGNIAEAQPEHGAPQAYLWGYSQSLPIAKAVNARRGSIFHTSFEESGTEGADAKTGKRYHVGSYTFSPPTGFTPMAGSTLSYWSWSNATGKWSLVEQAYNSGSVSCSGDKVDEVRIIPPNSQMITYTYAPLIGVTSMTDENGKTTYFDYDGLGRLWLIKDQDGNIVKEHQYFYKQ